MDFFILLHSFTDWGLLALRLVIGVIFLVHGLPKWKNWQAKPSKDMPASMIKIMRILSIAEPLGGVAVIAGFLTQLATLGLMIIMLGAISSKMKWHIPFSAHDNTGWEFDLLILTACFALYFTGAGMFGLDRMLFGL